MQIFKNFGVEPILLVAQIFNFLVILVILKKFLYKPVLEMLNKRQEDAKKAIDDALLAQKKLEEAEEKERQIILNANQKAEKIIENAKLEASEMATASELEAKAAADRILEEARLKISQETAEAEERLTKNIGRIAISLLEKSLGGIFGPKEQKVIMKKAEIQIGKVKP